MIPLSDDKKEMSRSIKQQNNRVRIEGERGLMMLKIIQQLSVCLNRWRPVRRNRLHATTVIQSDAEKGSAVHGKYYNWGCYRFRGGNDNSPQCQGLQRRIEQ
jgi:hypothetical protein